MNVRRPSKSYWLKYCIAFMVTFLSAYGLFFLYGKTFIMSGDGYRQHYRAIIYYGEWLRSLAHNIFIEHNFSIPTYHFGLGYGGDVITILHYYVIGDPVCLISALVPVRYMVACYMGCQILRLFISGITFSLYSFYMSKADEKIILAMSMAYIFSSFGMVGTTKHPMFAVPMVLFPLLLLGIEKILKENKHGVFIASIALSALSNFYFFYMIVILGIGYALIRLLSCSMTIMDKLVIMRSFLIDGTLGVLLGLPILLPMFIQVLSDSRSVKGYILPILYDKHYYRMLPAALTGGVSAGSWTLIGTTVLCIPIIVSVMVKHNEREMKLAFIGSIIMILFPFFGYALSAFTYASNRWSWAFCLLITFMMVRYWAYFEEYGFVHKKKLIWSVCIIYCLLCLYTCKSNSVSFKCTLVGTVILATFLLYMTFARKDRKDIVFAILVLLTVIINNIFQLHVSGYNFTDDYLTVEKADPYKVINSEATLLDEYSDEEFFRYTSKINNTSLNGRGSSCDFYFSMSNGYITDFLNKMGVSIRALYNYGGLWNRSVLESLLGVRYVVNPRVPTTYEKLSEIDKYEIYENKDAVPLGFFSRYVIKKSEIEKFTDNERQEVLTQAVVIDDDDISRVDCDLKDADSVEVSSYEIPSIISYDEGLHVNENQIYADKKNLIMNVTFDAVTGGEVYLCLDGFEFTGEDLGDNAITRALNAVDYGKLTVEAFFYNGDELLSNTEFITSVPWFKWSNGMSDFVVNGGYFDKEVNRVEIKFPKAGAYKIDNIRVVCQPLENSKENIERLNKNALYDIALNNDNEGHVTGKVTGRINAETDGVLMLSIPYSKGWTAYVDGHKCDVLNADIGFIGLPVSSGDHAIELYYDTPGLRIGIILSLITLLGLLIRVVYGRRIQKAFN